MEPVLGHRPTRTPLIQIQSLRPGDLILLNRNLGQLGGLVALSTVLSEPSEPEQYDDVDGVLRYYSYVDVEPRLILAEPLTHQEIKKALGKDLMVVKALNGIEPPTDAQLLDLFFERKFKV
jgi:hypothetical protein